MAHQRPATVHIDPDATGLRSAVQRREQVHHFAPAHLKGGILPCIEGFHHVHHHHRTVVTARRGSGDHIGEAVTTRLHAHRAELRTVQLSAEQVDRRVVHAGGYGAVPTRVRSLVDGDVHLGRGIGTCVDALHGVHVCPSSIHRRVEDRAVVHVVVPPSAIGIGVAPQEAHQVDGAVSGADRRSGVAPRMRRRVLEHGHRCGIGSAWRRALDPVLVHPGRRAARYIRAGHGLAQRVEPLAALVGVAGQVIEELERRFVAAYLMHPVAAGMGPCVLDDGDLRGSIGTGARSCHHVGVYTGRVGARDEDTSMRVAMGVVPRA
jgi:hypothetical protein